MKVKFLPKKSVDVEVCNIYEDRDAIIVQHTDTLQANTAFNAEALGFKFGIKPTAFHWPYSAIQDGLTDIANIGIIKFGVYVPTDRYRNESGGYYLPDYSSTSLTQDGADYYGRNVGETKLSGFPNNGQELFDYTSGVKGYDIINSVSGSENNVDFIREMEYVDEWYLQNFGRLPSSGSDRQGKIGSKEVYQPFYLGIRSTVVDNSFENHLYNDLDRLDFIHKKITSRWENGFIYNQKPEFNTRLINSINTAFDVNGMFNDFVHWHRTITYGGIQQLEELFSLIHSTVDGRNAWYIGYSEAVEYYWFRSMVKRVRGSIIDDKLYLIADFEDDFFNEKIAGIDKKLLYNRIKQPLSVKIDLTGTSLSGKQLKGADMISLGDNQYIVDIPFLIEDNYLQGVCIEETDTPEYKDFSPITYSNSSNVFTTNVPTKMVAYVGNFNQTLTVSKRDNNFKNTHNLNGYSYNKVGFVDKWGNSILAET